MADKETVRDVAKEFAELEDGMDKGFILGAMQMLMLMREKEPPEPHGSGPGDERKAG